MRALCLFRDSAVLSVLALLGAACSDDGSSGSAGTQSTGTESSSTGSSNGGASSTGTMSGTGGSTGSFVGSGGSGGMPACVEQTAEATLKKKPIDVIVLIDNSGSMTDEINGVQANMNTNFASILDASGLDYRVILVSRHGLSTSGQSVCIGPPLSGTNCTPPDAQPANGPKFFHYSTEIASTNSPCKIESTFATPDEFNLAPNGWKEWLRPDAFKVFLEITDDRVSCSFNGTTYNDANTAAAGLTAAMDFETSLFALDPQFGTAAERNYIWYSIIGMAANTPPTAPYTPTDPVVTTKCNTAANPGTGYQQLSILTGGLRFPLCDTSSYDSVFQAIAAGVLDGAKVDCSFPVPDPPMNQEIDLASVRVIYTPSDMSMPQTLTQVPTAADCVPGAFYIDNMTTIELCPATCTLVQADDMAKVGVLFDCTSEVQ